MIQRIAQIICDDLLNLKFVTPRIHTVLSTVGNLCFFLLCQNRDRLDLVFQKHRKIKALHHNLVVAELQLI